MTLDVITFINEEFYFVFVSAKTMEETVEDETSINILFSDFKDTQAIHISFEKLTIINFLIYFLITLNYRIHKLLTITSSLPIHPLTFILFAKLFHIHNPNAIGTSIQMLTLIDIAIIILNPTNAINLAIWPISFDYARICVYKFTGPVFLSLGV